MAGRHGPPLDLSLSNVSELSSHFRVRSLLDGLAHQRNRAVQTRDTTAIVGLFSVGGAVELLSHQQTELGALAAIGAAALLLVSDAKSTEIANIDTQALVLDTVLVNLPKAS